jgi:hypothetical protein
MNYPTKPHLYEIKPEPIITERGVKINEMQLFDDELMVNVELGTGGNWYFDKRSHYNGGAEADEFFLVQYEMKTKPNLNYEKQLKRYNVELENFNRLMEKYNAELVVFNKWQADITEKLERESYEKLKAKFEPKA